LKSWGSKIGDLENITDWVIVDKTNYIFNSNKPDWEPLIFKMSDLCNNNKKQPLRLSVNSYKNFGIHHCYGSVVTSLREIEMG
jgi:hypothetical protein